MTTRSPAGMALYIHWPFCKKKCPYCDFNSHVRADVDHARYRNALLTELRAMHAQMPDAELSSIFFGGGTPSLMQPETAHALIEEAQRLWPSISGRRERRNNAHNGGSIEITLEANPTSVEAETFAHFREAGVNRVSLGIQSLRPESLAFLGREHTAGEALAALERAAAQFDRYSFDLIYALPGQTEASWEQELREALRHAGGHMSLYQLTIEPNTAFHTAYFGKKAFILPDETTAAALYETTQRVMEEAGLPAYEISNHARPGEASRHNLSYWRSDAYIGIGPGAHGRMAGLADMPAAAAVPRSEGMGTGASQGKVAKHPLREQRVPTIFSTRTFKTPERWVERVETYGHGIEENIPITPEERMEEKLLMGLRLSEGLPLARFTPEERAHLDARVSLSRLNALATEGLLTTSATHWHTTPKGRLVLNAIIESLLAW